MAKDISIKQKQEWAETLFRQNELTQKEIAGKVGISEKTMCAWVKKFGWETLRKSLLTTKSERLRNLYDLLAKIDEKLKGDLDLKEVKEYADAYVKYAASIKHLETETSIAEIIEVARMFINNLQVKDPVFALSVANEFDLFIKDRLKRF
jgi:hypothetical protein